MSTSEDTPLYVVDTTVLSNFARVNRPDLLQAAVTPQAVMPLTVRQELEAGEMLDVVPRHDWSWLPIIDLDVAEQALAELFGARLDVGEAECLAVAETRQGTLVTDDRAARNRAAERGVRLSGTVGVLKLLIESGKLSLLDADGLLAAMVAEGFHAPVRSLAELVGQ